MKSGINSASLRGTKQSRAMKQIASFLAMTVLFSCNQNSSEQKDKKIDSVAVKVEEKIADVFDTSAKQQQPQTAKTVPAGDTLTPHKVSVVIFSNDTTADAALKGYGYNILMDGKLYVHQPHIPAVPGNKGFASVSDAKKAGALIKYKVEHHIMPPSVTVEELDSLKIRY